MRKRYDPRLLTTALYFLRATSYLCTMTRKLTLAALAGLLWACDRRPAEERLADRLCDCAKTQKAALQEVKKALEAPDFSEERFIGVYEASVAANDSCVKAVESAPEFVPVAADEKRLAAYRNRAQKLCVAKIREESEALFKKFKAKHTQRRQQK